jgi:hypothetical protein
MITWSGSRAFQPPMLPEKGTDLNACSSSPVLALLCGPNGAPIATVTRSTGWQPHTVRAFLAAVVRKKLGLRLESEKTDGERVYRIVAAKASGDATSVPSA